PRRTSTTRRGRISDSRFRLGSASRRFVRGNVKSERDKPPTRRDARPQGADRAPPREPQVITKADDAGAGRDRLSELPQLGAFGATTLNCTSWDSVPSALCTVMAQRPALSIMAFTVNDVSECRVIAPPSYHVHTPLGASKRTDIPFRK